jgi:hypothetical protein
MPIHVRSAAVSLAVAAFFAVGFICAVSGLSPFTCCKRAMVASIVAYAAAAASVKVVNRIVIDAMADKQVKGQKEKAGGRPS